jgi:hypothetical protein
MLYPEKSGNPDCNVKKLKGKVVRRKACSVASQKRRRVTILTVPLTSVPERWGDFHEFGISDPAAARSVRCSGASVPEAVAVVGPPTTKTCKTWEPKSAKHFR